MVVVDTVYKGIERVLAQHAPERGGALYGTRGYPLVTHFEYDPDAETSAASYVPSARLVGSVQRIEAQTGLEFKGIIHSHPRGLLLPSRQDEWAVSRFFELNPHYACMALPIVQQVTASLTAEGGGTPFLHWYRAERARKHAARRIGVTASGDRAASVPTVSVVAEEFHVLPLQNHVEQIAALLTRSTGAQISVGSQLQHLKLRNAELIGLVASASGGREFMYFTSIDYPTVAPVVLYQRQGSTQTLQMKWDGCGDEAEALAQVASNLAGDWAQASNNPYSANAALGI